MDSGFAFVSKMLNRMLGHLRSKRRSIRKGEKNMRHILLILVVMITSAFHGAESMANQELSNKKDLRVVVLEGSPYNRGLIHGKTLKKEINELVRLWKADLGKGADTFISN